MADNSLQLYETREKDTKWHQIPEKRKHPALLKAKPDPETAMIMKEPPLQGAVPIATVPENLPSERKE